MLRKFLEEQRFKRARQIMALCRTHDVALGVDAALLSTSTGKCTPLYTYRGDGDYPPSEGLLMRLPSSLDSAAEVVLTWQVANFDGRATLEGTLAHLGEELEEVRAAAAAGDRAALSAEVADVFVLLVQLSALTNTDLGEAVIEKMAVLLARDYTAAPDADGKIKHTTESDR